ncbi:ATP-binding protein [Kitasatospora sp. CM 4170]|uniref:ATP-binding protein n=1 Tax=Kitasatospora aburaviensis TaxID=67265 RepID=A0ABW1EST2_9ACTN|nr:ATP-binding protein [Kitasatospora sp. CM 4170]WNM44080.1 ATP-binding protein [Kitasatospora sp. CM 4170]
MTVTIITDTVESLSAVRRDLADQLYTWELPGLVDDAVLILCELATNALTHGAGPVWYRLRRIVDPAGGGTVRLEVGDHGPGRPAGSLPGAQAPADACHGRGLHIVASLAAAWGTAVLPHGHLVWAELPG